MILNSTESLVASNVDNVNQTVVIRIVLVFLISNVTDISIHHTY